MADYAHPEVLVSTQWVQKHRQDPNVRLAEVDVDTGAYDEGHIAGAVGWSWQTQLCDTIRRDIVPKTELEKLLGQSGIDNKTMIVLYGDNNNWFACWAFWQLKIYGHEDVRVMNGGRKKWLAEERDLVKGAPKPPRKNYEAKDPNLSIRAFLPEVQRVVDEASMDLVDVRSPQEFTGEILAPPGLPETCQRGGHLPGARGITWSLACKEDGTFKSHDELKALYQRKDIPGTRPVIAYCRIGERSSLTWFVLKYLLGYPDVRNYDGSWTEWGNLVGATVERGA